ncbi:MAG: prolipoprotein diacylglyceryl transferase [Deltaproteobacteria bacterium]|nr:prolipoprotein diacylglyceryl transferase [Deltaproteobacteria bacterium]
MQRDATSSHAEGGHSAGRLEAWVHASHRVRIAGRAYHPYFLATDLGTVAIAAFSAWFCAWRTELSFPAFLAAFLVMQASYFAVRALRARYLGMTSRSFLQDSVLVILPAFAIASVGLGNDILASLDLAALDLALGATFIRVGCFLGGCCYGRVARWGVAYPSRLLVPVRGCRTYTPGEMPAGRVIPIQLFESAFNACAFVALLAWSREGAPSGHLLPGYLGAYGLWRLVSDFWRASSARPRRMGLSEAQWASLVVVVVAGVVLMRP